jgi:hypothetical protein
MHLREVEGSISTRVSIQWPGGTKGLHGGNSVHQAGHQVCTTTSRRSPPSSTAGPHCGRRAVGRAAAGCGAGWTRRCTCNRGEAKHTGSLADNCETFSGSPPQSQPNSPNKTLTNCVQTGHVATVHLLHLSDRAACCSCHMATHTVLAALSWSTWLTHEHLPSTYIQPDTRDFRLPAGTHSPQGHPCEVHSQRVQGGPDEVSLHDHMAQSHPA